MALMNKGLPRSIPDVYRRLAALEAASTTPPQPSNTAGAAIDAATGSAGTSEQYARGDHKHPMPGASNGTIRGTVLRAAAQANSTATDVAGVVADLNALLAKLRTAGVIAP